MSDRVQAGRIGKPKSSQKKRNPPITEPYSFQTTEENRRILPFNKTPYFFDFGPWQGKTIHHLTYDEKSKDLGKTYLINCLDHPFLLRNKPDLVTAFRSLDDIYYNKRWQVAWAMYEHGFSRTERKGSKYIHPESYLREERSVLLSCDETPFDQFIQCGLTSHWMWAKEPAWRYLRDRNIQRHNL
jgi:hypothetical protein